MRKMPTKTTKKKTKTIPVAFVTLGCDKNLVDAQEMLGLLEKTPYRITDEEAQAKAAVVNTCCFIDDAKKESIDEILRIARLKTEGALKALVVTGCLAQRYREEILREIPEVDAVVGVEVKQEVVAALDEALSRRKTKKRLFLEGELSEELGQGEQRLSETPHTAFLKIAEGCDKHCTYCVIPSVRGRYRSVPMERLLQRAQDLVRQGARELVLVAQETTRYGTDLYGEKKLPELITKLSWITDLRWIRVLYCYPEEITPELIAVLRDNPKVLHYLDMPIQHASDAVLRRMGRRTSRRDIEEKVRLLRAEIPDICIRTTLLSGFPGETAEDHEALKRFVKRMKFDRLGVFAYSKEENTPAAKMKPQVPVRLRRKRRDELMALQQEIAFRAAARCKGRVLPAIVDGMLPEEGVCVARTYRDAPEVDGLVFFPAKRDYLSGEIVNVKITGSRGYDLIGEVEHAHESAQ